MDCLFKMKMNVAGQKNADEMPTGCKYKKSPLSKWEKKNGKLLTSHRYDHLPLLPSGPGGFSRSWSYKTCRRKDKEPRIKFNGWVEKSIPE